MCDRNRDERGFVLVTTLVILMILTIMLVGLYLRGKVNQDTSISERDSTQAFYLAEAGLNYITWALYMDPNNPGKDNNVDLDGDGVADNVELQTTPNQANNPPASNTLGYFDINNTINFDPVNPTTVNLSTLAIPKHVALDITVTSPSNNVSVSPQAFGSGTALPSGNGAVVWLVPAVLDTSGIAPLSEKDTMNTSNDYAVYAYSIGYVNGKPLRMLRAKIGSASNSFPANLGSMTNGYQ
ncbi:MAG TPA: pilus assembly PilX N-terminal domain-containing protein [Mariprofundaceae bacterium]|nr:pilus assembly PilX N-terminal domain-containing protein [Mariprofundaceae bacterium]